MPGSAGEPGPRCRQIPPSFLLAANLPASDSPGDPGKGAGCVAVCSEFIRLYIEAWWPFLYGCCTAINSLKSKEGEYFL